MPVGPTLAARGPDDIVKRLKVGLAPLAGSVHRVTDGKVTLWKDYWDFGALANSAPP
jgi:limonene-1,2-epoxide hydrolase